MDQNLVTQRWLTAGLLLSVLLFGMFVAGGAAWFNWDWRKAGIVLGCSAAFIAGFAGLAFTRRRSSIDSSSTDSDTASPLPWRPWTSLGTAVLAWAVFLAVNLFPPTDAAWALGGVITIFIGLCAGFFLGIISLGDRKAAPHVSVSLAGLLLTLLLVTTILVRAVFRV